MIALGKKQELIVAKVVDFGVYLGEKETATEKDTVLLPGKQVPEGTKKGDKLNVFIYKDSQDRLIATTKEPKLSLGDTAMLKVAQVTRIGAFLDWGLEKDLFLPYKEQTKKVHEGEEILVALYVDKSSRLCATMKVYHYLQTDSPYAQGDAVTGLVYEISDNFGVFVAVDEKYSGRIPKQEAQGNYKPGMSDYLSCNSSEGRWETYIERKVKKPISSFMKMQKMFMKLSRNLKESFLLMIRLHQKLFKGNSDLAKMLLNVPLDIC